MKSKEQPRLRMFAGPNGSGKSTIKANLKPELVGIYVNADEIEKEIQENGFYNFSVYPFKIDLSELTEHFQNSALLKENNILVSFKLKNNQFHHNKNAVNSYITAVLSDFLRKKILQEKLSFSFETVMSFPDKVDLLQTAKELGYKTYLYFVATESPLINIARGAYRVKMGGHPVPDDKITTRYHKSLDLLINAIHLSDRAYIFDNSGDNKIWLAEITNGKNMELKTDNVPEWFATYVLNKI